MLEIIESNPMIVFGVAGCIGAGVRGAIAYVKAKKENKKLEFDISIFGDTLAEGAAAGVGISLGLPLNYVSLGVAALSGAGVDSYTNKLGIKIFPMLKDLAKNIGTKKKKK
jgi:hypothetical protein